MAGGSGQASASAAIRDPAGLDAPPVDLKIDAGRTLKAVFWTCLAIEVLLVVLDAVVNYGGLSNLGPIRRLFNTTREDALASWFATSQALLLALTLWCIYALFRARDGVNRWRTRGWLLLAIGFSYVAVDDGAEIHERLGSGASDFLETARGGVVARSWFGRLLESFPSYSWQVVVLPLFVLLGVFVAAFVICELRDRRSIVVVGAALALFAVAVGLDFIEGLDEGHPWNVYSRLAEVPGLERITVHLFAQRAFEALRHFSKSIEEFLEMFATTLLWIVFLNELLRRVDNHRLRTRSTRSTTPGDSR